MKQNFNINLRNIKLQQKFKQNCGVDGATLKGNWEHQHWKEIKKLTNQMCDANHVTLQGDLGWNV